MKARIKFRKYGVMRFIGHLDVMRYFQKAMRRADIPIAFTSGYSPHMIMSFAQPLGVGVTSDGEYLDIELKGSISSEKAVKQLNAVMVEGMFVDGSGVGDVGSVVLRDRRHLAEDGMVVVVAAMSGEDGALVSGPDIITRGFVYVKESEGLMEELRQVALDSILSVDNRYATDWSAIKQTIKGDLSNYLYKKTKRSPMILPVIMEV